MPRTTRRERNQALFREVNDRIAGLGAHFDELAGELGPGPAYAFVCECATTGCRASVELSVATYVAVRAEPAAFVVAHGHERPLQEDVLWSGDGFVVVRPKRNSAGLRLASTPTQRSPGRKHAAAV